MHLKQKGYCLGVLLIYTITTVTLLSVGWCEPAAAHPLHPSFLHSLTRPSTTEGRGWQHLDSRPGTEPRSLPYLKERDGNSAKTSRGRPEETLELKMASTSAEKYLETRSKPEQTEAGRLHPSRTPPSEGGCGKGSIQHIIRGKFYITGQLQANIPKVGYQPDSAASDGAPGGQERIRGQRVRGSEESWQRLQPVVECGDYAMTLTVRRRRAAQLLMDRVNESSVPLSQLPPQCGYSVQTTWRDFTLMAQYDACHVTEEDDSYVLPLLWRGTPVKMSCPVSQIQPQAVGPSSLCCSPYGMTVKVQGLPAAEELRVNVRGEWIPLVVVTEQCGYTLHTQDGEIIIAAPFLTCGITVKENKYTLSLQFEDKTFRLACPDSPPEELPLTHQPLVNRPHHVTRGQTKHMEPIPWAPPFYLAPLYYPHPTYHHTYTSPKGQGTHSPPTPSSSTLDPTFGPQPLPPIDSHPDYQDHYHHQIPVREFHKPLAVHGSPSSMDDMEHSSRVFPNLQQKQETPVLDLLEKHSATHPPISDSSSLNAAPSLQLPSHAFNQYYHNYHHPKIPLSGPPHPPDPGPEVPKEQSLTNPHDLEYSVLLPNVQQSDTLSKVNSDQFLQPVPEGHPYTFPTNPPYTRYPPQPYPHHYYYYFPYITRGEAKRLAPFNPDMDTKTNLCDYQNTDSSTFVHPCARSSEVHDKHNLKPYTDLQKPDKMIDPSNHPLSFEDDHDDDNDIKAALDDRKRHTAHVTPAGQLLLPPSYPPGQTSLPTSSPNHNLPPYPHYYHHPYYHYYQMFYGPHSLFSADNYVSPSLSKEALDPLHRASSSTPQHPYHHKHRTTTPPTKSMYDVHSGLLHPYYHLYYQPKMSVDNQELDPAGSMNFESDSQLPSDSDFSWMDWLVHPFNHFGHPDGEAEQRLGNEMRNCDRNCVLVACVQPFKYNSLCSDLNTPSASPCRRGPVADFDCSASLDCCSYPVKGQCVSCALQRLASDPNIYFVPLDGCGVNKHVFGQTVIHLLEIHGFHSLQQDSSVHDSSPVRLMVECSSSPGSPGQVRLHVMDRPPPPPVQSTLVPVQLRIATDESFTSFHPEAHLPLSLMRGRPVYVEVSLLDPPEPDLMLLVHSCLAYTQSPYPSWMLVYDGYIYFLCLTDVCSAADGGCTVGCINSKSNPVEE
ncbi:hypothetical protein L3Q82_014452, partial [Scortum barcoo]